MRIQHNIAALNSYRNLTNNNSAVSKNLEKLSSGYRINRAGDDAAGLAISEKMRAQITGLKTAQKNANDGISLVQTAEGAMTEIHSMLNRMVELADQSANGTYADEVDRENLQKEISSLKDEINRIADATNFNGINLLDGSLAASGGSATNSVGKIEGIGLLDVDATKGKYEMSAALATPAANTAGKTFDFSISLTDAEGNATKEISLSYTCDGTTWKDADGNVLDITSATTVGNSIKTALEKDATIKDNFTITNTNGLLKFEAKTAGAGTMQVKSINVVDAGDVKANGIKATAGTDAYQALDLSSMKIYVGSGVATPSNNGTNKLEEATFTVNGKKFAVVDRAKLTDDMKAELKAAGVSHFLDVTGDKWADVAGADVVDALNKITTETGLTGETGTVATGQWTAGTTDGNNHIILKSGTSTKAGGGLTLQIGDTSADFNQLRVSVSDMHTKALGIADIDISTQAGAKDAVDLIKTAINKVSSTRGDLGAIQNRLEHTINNLSVTTENMTAAESRIRDTDMAEEMMAYTKNNILVQASQAMLAQANQIPQGVLQLLQ